MRDIAGRTLVVLFWQPGDSASDSALRDAVAFAQSRKDVFLVPMPLGNHDPISIHVSLKQAGYTGPVFLDALGDTSAFMGAKSAPRFMVADADGILRAAVYAQFDAPIASVQGLTVQQITAGAAAGGFMAFPDDGLYAEAKNPQDLMGRTAPDFSLMDARGAAVSLSGTLAQKPAVVIFYSIGCPYSRKELVALQNYAAQTSGDKYQILAVTSSGDSGERDQITRFFFDNGICFLQERGEIGWVVIDTKATVRAVNVGYMENTGDMLDTLFDALKN